MIVVVPICAKDWQLAKDNLNWWIELDGSVPYDCVLSHDDETPASAVADVAALCKQYFKSVDVFWYPAPIKRYWPAAQNCAFQSAARYMAAVKTDSWLWMEADATAIRKGWLSALETEHLMGGKPITGHVVDGDRHPNGVAIYPPMLAAYSLQAMQVEDTAWDVVIGATVDRSFIHNVGMGEYQGQPANHLMQHCWNMHEQTGEPTNGHGYSPTFKSAEEAVRKVDLKACLYHRCKDGSLIRALREFYKNPAEVMVPNHTAVESRINDDTKSTERGGAADVRRDGGVVADAAPTVLDSGEPVAVPKTEIFIVTYGKDAPWFAWALRAIRRHCTGFTGVTLAIPDRDAAAFVEIAGEHAKAAGGISLRIRMFKEKPGKGMLAHMAVMGSADEFVKDAEFVLHLDADCIFKEPTTPNDYIHNGKPEYVWRTYASLAEVRDGQKVVSDCAQWKAPTEAQLGFEVEQYTMARHPTVFPIGFYKPYRKHIELLHGKQYLDYMTSGKNEFPQSRMDFTAMGAWAFKFMHDKFHWIDVSGGNHLAPRDRQKTYWSHGGVTTEVQKEIEGFLK